MTMKARARMNKRRGQTQYRILCSQGPQEQFEAEALRQIRATIHHLPGKPAAKKDIADALVTVALRHPDEISAEVLRLYGVDPAALATPREAGAAAPEPDEGARE